MRLVNPTDVQYISRLVPESFAGLDSIIPLLRQGEGIIMGDAILIPQRVQMDIPNPPPESIDVRFFDKWRKPGEKTNAKDVMDRWWNQKKT